MRYLILFLLLVFVSCEKQEVVPGDSNNPFGEAEVTFRNYCDRSSLSSGTIYDAQYNSTTCDWVVTIKYTGYASDDAPYLDDVYIILDAGYAVAPDCTTPLCILSKSWTQVISDQEILADDFWLANGNTELYVEFTINDSSIHGYAFGDATTSCENCPDDLDYTTLFAFLVRAEHGSGPTPCQDGWVNVNTTGCILYEGGGFDSDLDDNGTNCTAPTITNPGFAMDCYGYSGTECRAGYIAHTFSVTNLSVSNILDWEMDVEYYYNNGFGYGWSEYTLTQSSDEGDAPTISSGILTIDIDPDQFDYGLSWESCAWMWADGCHWGPTSTADTKVKVNEFRIKVACPTGCDRWYTYTGPDTFLEGTDYPWIY